MSTEAMKLALEALEWDDCYDTAVALKEAAIERLRKAIAEAEKQKPVDFEAIIEDIETIDCMYRGSPSYEHCPYKIRKEAADTVRRHASYYTHPQPKREWVGLTDEEIEEIAKPFYPRSYGLTGFAREIEAAHGIKEKNT